MEQQYQKPFVPLILVRGAGETDDQLCERMKRFLIDHYGLGQPRSWCESKLRDIFERSPYRLRHEAYSRYAIECFRKRESYFRRLSKSRTFCEQLNILLTF